jgi:7-keto-8-aminopelargonate synthetase-like enzyme
MSEERLAALEDRIEKAFAAGGAQVTLQDPRINTFVRAAGGVFASITIIVMVWVASSINRLNETMARVATQNEAIMNTLVDHADRIKDMERRNATR